MGSIAWRQRMALWETKHLVECLEILQNYGRDVTCHFKVKTPICGSLALKNVHIKVIHFNIKVSPFLSYKMMLLKGGS